MNTEYQLPALVDQHGHPLTRSGVDGPFPMDSQEVAAWFGGIETEAGVPLTHAKALAYAPWWRGINLISRQVAKLPLLVYRRKGEDRERDPRHRAYRILRRKANEHMVSLHVKLVLTAHALDRGNGYGYIERGRDQKPIGIWPLDPTATWPVRVNGELWYITRFTFKGEHIERKLKPKDVLHIKGLGYDGLCGYDAFTLARQSIGLGLAAEKHGQRFFKNSAVPGVVLEAPHTVKAEVAKEIISNFNKMVQGLENNFKTALLHGGVTANTLAIDARKAQLIQTREFEVKAAANYLSVPPHKLGDSDRVSYNSLEQENQSFLDDGLDFWLCAWEEECHDKLLSDEEQETDSHFVEFLREALVRADLKTRGEYYRTATGGRAWMTPDEVRHRENMPAKGGQADELLDPLNMAGGDADADEPAEEPAEDPDDEQTETNAARAAVRAVLVDATRRAAKRVTVRLGKEWTTYGRQQALGDQALRSILKPALTVAGVTFARSIETDEAIASLVDSAAGCPQGKDERFAAWAETFIERASTELVEFWTSND